MTLGIFLWMIVFLVLFSDSTQLLLYGIFLVVAIIVGVVVAYRESKKNDNF